MINVLVGCSVEQLHNLGMHTSFTIDDASMTWTLRALVAVGCTCLVGLGGHIVSLRRSHRRLFRSINPNRFMGAIIGAEPSTAVVVVYPRRSGRMPLDIGGTHFDAWTLFALVQGVVACTCHVVARYHHGHDHHMLVSMGTYALYFVSASDAVGLISTCAEHVMIANASASDAFAKLAIVAVVAGGAARIAAIFDPFGAARMACEGIAGVVAGIRSLCQETRRVSAAEQNARAHISGHAFATAQLASPASATTTNVHIYLHRESIYDNIERLYFLSVFCDADDACYPQSDCRALDGHRLTARVDFRDPAHVIVIVSIDADESAWNRTSHSSSAKLPHYEEVVEGLSVLRTALARSSDAFATILSRAAGELLASVHWDRERAHCAQRTIRRAWNAVVSDPGHSACVRRLRREFDALQL